MIRLLEKIFIGKDKDLTDPKVRSQYGTLGGVLGIVCNILLFALKITIGIIMNSLAILSDAFNNLSDMFSSIVSIFSAKLSAKKPDKDHPFGHGRIEYIATMIVAMVIIVVGFELIMSSIEKIIAGVNGTAGDLVFSWVSIGILAASLLVKLWMFFYNRYLGKKINSSVLMATATDSINDVITTTAVLLVTIAAHLWFEDYYFYADGAVGIIIGGVIIFNGIKIVIESIGDLLGRASSEEEVNAIEEFLLKDPHILGCHDCIVHDYGPGRKFAVVHCEVDQDSDIVEAHEVIDGLENKIEAQLGIFLTVHMDPIDNKSETIVTVRGVIQSVIDELDERLTFHDLRITNGEHNINVIFDMVVPFEYTNEKIHDTISAIRVKVKQIDPKYTTVVKIDHKM